MKLTPATKFWIGIGGYVLLADTILWRSRHDTMSVQFGKWLQTPRGRTACIAAWGTLTAHLFWGYPLPFQSKARRILGGRKDD